MKKLILLAATILMVYTAKAQFSDFAYGVKGGLNVSNLTKIDQKDKISYHLGVFAEWRLSDLFAIQPELVYSRQGARDKYEGDEGKVKLKTRINYLNLPILAKFYVLEGLSVDIGPQIGLAVSKKVKSRVDGHSSKDKLEHVETFDLSLAAGVSYNIENIILSARYNFGLTDAFDKNAIDYKSKNHVFQVSVGFRLDNMY